MASIQKFKKKKWRAVIRRNKIVATKVFLRKSDASKWAYHTEALIETGAYKRVQESERLADIRVSEILNIYYEKHIKIKSIEKIFKKLINLLTIILKRDYIIY